MCESDRVGVQGAKPLGLAGAGCCGCSGTPDRAACGGGPVRPHARPGGRGGDERLHLRVPAAPGAGAGDGDRRATGRGRESGRLLWAALGGAGRGIVDPGVAGGGIRDRTLQGAWAGRATTPAKAAAARANGAKGGAAGEGGTGVRMGWGSAVVRAWFVGWLPMTRISRWPAQCRSAGTGGKWTSVRRSSNVSFAPNSVIRQPILGAQE